MMTLNNGTVLLKTEAMALSSPASSDSDDEINLKWDSSIDGTQNGRLTPN
jgi:hypothetical protein